MNIIRTSEFPSERGTVTYDELVHVIKNYSSEDALLFISKVSAAIFEDSPSFRNSEIGRHVPRGVSLWQLIFLARTLILESNDYRRLTFDQSALFRCGGLYNDLDDSPITSRMASAEEVYAFLMRTAYQQFPLQMAIKFLIPRYTRLFRQTAEQKQMFDMDKAFSDLHGLSISDFMTLGFLLFATFQKSPVLTFPIGNLPNQFKDIWVQDKVERFIQACGTSYADFRARQRSVKTRPGYEKYEFNTLYQTPIIRSERKKHLIAPIPMALLHRSTVGILHELMTAYYRGDKRNDFRTYFGKNAFEPYVGWLLEGRGDAVIPEIQYADGKRTCDWIIVESNRATLIECKMTGLTLEEKTFAELDVLKSFTERIVSGVRTCHRTQQDAIKGVHGLERLSGISEFKFLIVVLDEVYLGNAPPAREALEPAVHKALGISPEYQIISTVDFELLCGSGLSIFDLVDSKLRDKEMREWDFKEFFLKHGEQANIEILKTNISNTKLEREFEDFFGGIKLG